MKRFSVGFLGGIILVIILFFWWNQKKETARVEEMSNLIQLQLENVGKLVVTEASYSEIFSYEDSKDYFQMLSFTKKTLVVVNARATISYDLSKIGTYLDAERKEVHITFLPEKEVNIYPEIYYYDITQDYFNQFNSSDFNKIKRKVDKLIQKKIKESNLAANADERLIAELQQIYFLTNSMGWSLHYNTFEVESQNDFERLMQENLYFLK